MALLMGTVRMGWEFELGMADGRSHGPGTLAMKWRRSSWGEEKSDLGESGRSWGLGAQECCARTSEKVQEKRWVIGQSIGAEVAGKKPHPPKTRRVRHPGASWRFDSRHPHDESWNLRRNMG